MSKSDQKNLTRGHIPTGLMDYLDPDLIYRFNQMFISAWKQGDIGYINNKKTAFFTLSYFNSHTRTFNWVSIGVDIWDPQSPNSKKAVKKLKKILKRWNDCDCEDTEFTTETYCERKKDWKTLWNDFPEGGIYNYARRICKDLNFSEPNEDHRAMLGLYSGFHFQEETNIEGIFVRYLKALALKTSSEDGTNYLSGTLKIFVRYLKALALKTSSEDGTNYLSGTLEKSTENQEAPFDWFLSDSKIIPKYQNIRDPDPEKQYEDEISKEQSSPKAKGIQELSEKFFEQLLSEPDGFGGELAKRPNILLIPIYEVWLEDTLTADAFTPRDKADIRGFGRIKAVILLFFENRRKRNKWKKKKLPILCNQLPRIASTIIEASKTQALSQPIKPPYDLLRHFISVLAYVQDWESAYVVDTTKDKGDSNYIVFCYKREEKSNSPIVEWKKVPVEQNDIRLPCNSSTIQCKDDKRFMWWTCDLWSKELIHGLGDEERKAFSRFDICFEFPKACYIPTDTDLKKRMRNVYLRQQLDLMNLLIPRVQRRRAALRSAVSAIMGRNMSHNIGSHVIAQAGNTGDSNDSNDLGEQRVTSIERDVDVFFRYLQRRMDFVAEVSTSDKPNWSQCLGLVEVLAALDFEKEKRRINTKGGNKYKPILLSYITGKKDIKASVCIDQKTNKYFNCPGGEVGAHALYIILENIIRNSARHNKLNGVDTIKLKIEVGSDDDDSKLLKLIITDCQTDGNEEKSGKLLKDHINDIIQNEMFLKEDGSPNSNYWGIREMQICAQYLRGLPLSDLEAPPSVGSLPVLKAFKKEENLAYWLYLQRPKLCAIVSDQICDQLKKKEKKLKAMGIALFDFDKISEALTELRGYGFVVFPEGREKDLLDKKLLLPVRTLYVKNCFIKKFLANIGSRVDSDEFKPEELLEPLYKVLWKDYRDKRKDWKCKDIKVFVGWENIDDSVNKGIDRFCHLPTSDLKLGLGKESLINLLDSSSPHKSILEATRQDIEDIREKLKKEKKLGIVWIDHADMNDFQKIISDDPIIFRSILDSSSPHKSILEATRQEPIGNELIAAALGRVIVLDERVQHEEQKGYRGILYKNLLPCMGIWVPSAQDCDLNNPNFCKIRQFLKKQSPAEFLILHLTILESLTKQCSFKSDQETLGKLIEDIEAVKGCEVIIVTGRGVPSGSMETLRMRYLPISVLLEYLISRPSKLLLMRALWNANATLEKENQEEKK